MWLFFYFLLLVRLFFVHLSKLLNVPKTFATLHDYTLCKQKAFTVVHCTDIVTIIFTPASSSLVDSLSPALTPQVNCFD